MVTRRWRDHAHGVPRRCQMPMKRALFALPPLAAAFLAPPTVALVVACAGGTPAAGSPSACTIPTTGAVQSSPDSPFREALANPARTEKERARDGYRNPAETL